MICIENGSRQLKVVPHLRFDSNVSGIAVKHSSLDWNIVTQTVSEPYGNHLFTTESFNNLEYRPLSCNLGPITEQTIGECRELRV